MSRRRADSMTSSDARSATLSRKISPAIPTSANSHVSLYQSLRMQLQIYSPSVRAHQSEGDNKRPLAVFSNHDEVGGKVILHRSCYHTGRLSISIEGAFTYSPTFIHLEGVMAPESSQTPVRRRHIFFSSSKVIHVSPSVDSLRSAFRDAFNRRRPSLSSLNLHATALDKDYQFVFELPRSCRSGEEMPPSFNSQDAGSSASAVDVTYTVKAVWEASNAIDAPSVLEVPILFHPDHDFQSMDVSSPKPQSWLEMPLKGDRPMPFRCAVTLPMPVTFSRPSSISYFVVFTTIPRSRALAREIAADATISVSLLRQVNVTEQTLSPPTPPHTPSSSSDESDVPRRKFLKAYVPRGQLKTMRGPKMLEHFYEVHDKPLPQLPNQTFTRTTTLSNNICIGFPKRPRHQLSNGQGHPTLESHAALPDGLYKSKVLLQKEMLPSIDWAGISVKYYLDISVLVGQDDLRARIPVRII